MRSKVLGRAKDSREGGHLYSTRPPCGIFHLHSGQGLQTRFPSSNATGFGSQVSGLGFRASGFGFQLSRFGFLVSGSGFQVPGFGFRLRFRVSGFGFQVSGFGFRVSGFGLTRCHCAGPTAKKQFLAHALPTPQAPAFVQSARPPRQIYQCSLNASCQIHLIIWYVHHINMCGHSI